MVLVLLFLSRWVDYPRLVKAVELGPVDSDGLAGSLKTQNAGSAGGSCRSDHGQSKSVAH